MITVKDLLDFIDKNQVPDDAVITVPKGEDGGYYPTTVWSEPDNLSVDWDLDYRPEIDKKFFIGDI
jgi:hypothetical protein